MELGVPIQPMQPPKPNLWRSKPFLVIYGVVLVFAVLIAWLAFHPQHKAAKLQPIPKTATIEITDKGFVPKLITVDKDTIIIWVNKDSSLHHVESNPYPEATEHPDLQSHTAINTGASYSYKVSQSGEYNFHDRLHPEFNGRIVVN